MMKKLTITIETDANVSKEELFALSTTAVNSITESLEGYWDGATIQSSKIEVEIDVK